MRRRAIAFALASLLALTSGATAQSDYPSRPVRIIVNSAPGGGTDILARVITQQMSKGGVSFFVENRGGGGGIVGIEAVRNAPRRRLCAVDDAEHRRGAARGHQGGALRSDQGFRRDHPGRRHLQRAGGASRRAGEDAAGADRAGEVQARRAQLWFGRRRQLAAYEHGAPEEHGGHRPAAHPVQRHRAGHDRGAVRPRVGAVLEPAHRQAADRGRQASRAGDLGPTRVSALPDVPTVAEAGVPGYSALQWYGLLAPAGTPQPAIDKLQAIVADALHTNDVRDRLAQDSAEPVGSKSAEFAALIKSDMEKWVRIAKAANIQAE